MFMCCYNGFQFADGINPRLTGWSRSERWLRFRQVNKSSTTQRTGLFVMKCFQWFSAVISIALSITVCEVCGWNVTAPQSRRVQQRVQTCESSHGSDYTDTNEERTQRFMDMEGTWISVTLVLLMGMCKVNSRNTLQFYRKADERNEELRIFQTISHSSQNTHKTFIIKVKIRDQGQTFHPESYSNSRTENNNVLTKLELNTQTKQIHHRYNTMYKSSILTVSKATVVKLQQERQQHALSVLS